MISDNGTSSDPNSCGGPAPAPERLSSLVYGLGVSAGVLLLITTITFVSFLCMRASAASTASAPPPAQRRRRRAEEEAAPPEVECAGGLDEATLKGCPKVAYAEVAKRGMPSTAACCSICLADYQDADALRLLPECGHMFHIDCVDTWLKAHPTCPVCRSSPMPTPLAEAVPLAMAQRSSNVAIHVINHL